MFSAIFCVCRGQICLPDHASDELLVEGIFLKSYLFAFVPQERAEPRDWLIEKLFKTHLELVWCV